mmetsp:Transcript_10499/g.21388  ORF Transcript_10499/g.21388 Transcript_10499/m.21388 type:complete len:108 (+) Transcript_10499:275-598(+)
MMDVPQHQDPPYALLTDDPPQIQAYNDEGTNHHLFLPRILSLPRSPQGTVSVPPSPHTMLFRSVLVQATIPRATYPFDVLPWASFFSLYHHASLFLRSFKRLCSLLP